MAKFIFVLFYFYTLKKHLYEPVKVQILFFYALSVKNIILAFRLAVLVNLEVSRIITHTEKNIFEPFAVVVKLFFEPFKIKALFGKIFLENFSVRNNHGLGSGLVNNDF